MDASISIVPIIVVGIIVILFGLLKGKKKGNKEPSQQVMGETAMFCSNCGARLTDGDKFCAECGNKIV